MDCQGFTACVDRVYVHRNRIVWATHGVQAQPLAIRACPQTATDRCSCCHTGVLSKPVPRFHHILDWDSDVPARTIFAIFYYHSHAMGILVVLWVLLPSANIFDSVFGAQHQQCRIQAFHGVDHLVLSPLWWSGIYGVHGSVH